MASIRDISDHGNALEAAASDLPGGFYSPLYLWLEDHRGPVRAVLRRFVEAAMHAEIAEKTARGDAGKQVVRVAGNVFAGDAISLRQAVDWAINAAEGLASNTHFEDGHMVEDEQGASVSTFNTLRNYGGMGKAEALQLDLATHMAAIEALRLHSGTQLSRQDWEKAYNAINTAYVAEYGAAEPPSRIFNARASPKSGLDDGTKYEFKDGKAHIRTQIKRSGAPKVNDLLDAAGIPRAACRSYRGAGEAYKAWYEVDAAWVKRVAEVLAPYYPTLAAAMTQNAPVWAAGRTPSSTGAGSTSVPDVDVSGLDPLEGEAYGLRWWWNAEAGRARLGFPPNTYVKKPMLAANVTHGWHVVALPNGQKDFQVDMRTSEAAKSAVAVANLLGRAAGEVAARLAVLWTSEAVISKATSTSTPDSNNTSTGMVAVGDLDPLHGSAHGLQWSWNPEKYLVTLVFPPGKYVKTPLEDAGFTVNWNTEKGGVNFVTKDTRKIAASGVIGRLLGSDAQAVIQNLAQAWNQTHADLRQSKEQGDVEDGSWTLKGNGYIDLVLRGKVADAVGWQKRIPGVVVKGSKDSNGVYHWAFNVKRVQKVADYLHQYYPRVCEALRRAYGGVALVAEEEAEACDPLIDMSGARTPADVTSAVGKAALHEIETALSKRLPHGRRLYKYQTVGVGFAKLTNYRCGIFDDMGLGKTAQALACIAVNPEMLLPAVVVCPGSVWVNWQRESNMWLPTVAQWPIKTGNDDLPPAGWKGLVVITWDMLRKFGAKLHAWGPKLVIADEAHYAINARSLQGKAIGLLSEGVPHLLLLSGTPIKNRAVEIWHLLHMLDPETWGTRDEFGRQFAEVTEVNTAGGTITKYEGGQNLDELNKRLKCTMIRRLKDEVDELPPKIRTIVHVQLTDPQRKQYKAAEKEFKDWYEAEVTRRIKKLAEDNETGASVDMIGEAARNKVARAMLAKAIVELGQLRGLIGRIKIEPALEQIESFYSANKPLVVFCEHRDVVEGLMAGLAAAKIPATQIIGGMSPDKKQAAIDGFQQGKYAVVVCTKAAEAGITLTRAADTLFVERWWTPGSEMQAEDRIHRIGQTRSCTIWYLNCDGTIDDRMFEIIEAKRAIVKGALGLSDIKSLDAQEDDVKGGVVSGLIGGEHVSAPVEPKRNPRNAKAQESVRSIPQHTTIQSLLLDRTVFSNADAKHWARMHGFKHDKLDVTAQYVRIRQRDPGRFVRGTFRTITLSDTVKAIIGLPKSRG